MTDSDPQDSGSASRRDGNDGASDDVLRDLLRDAAPSHFDAGFEDRVMARFAAAPALRLLSTDDTIASVGRRWLPWLAAAAALLAIVDRRESRANVSAMTATVAQVSDVGIPDWSAYQ